MKISLNWLKKFIEIDLPVDQLVERLGSQLGAVESITDLSKTYCGIIVAKVVSVDDHPNADKLHLCKIDDNRRVENIERDAAGLVQVVCGANNVHADMLVAWLPPGSNLPETLSSQPTVLESRQIRGQISHGMLASAKELALGDEHTGILEIDLAASPGDDLATIYELNDYIIDLENKMFTHRPDCFGQLGVAREIAGILGKPFISPDWYKLLPQARVSQAENLQLEVQNELPELVPRFMAVALSGVSVKPLTLLMQSYLIRLGIRPINNVVDITNYMMILTGQPLHAYDYDKVRALSDSQTVKLVIRNPKVDEKLKLLNGKEINLSNDTIMISTDKQAIGLAGVMGGAETEVDQKTKNLILECASFDMYSIRRTAMKYGLSTDAVTRFTKGQSPLQNDRILEQTLRLLDQYCGAQLASSVIDINQLGDRAWLHPPVPVSVDFINSRLGLQLDSAAIKLLLENVECQVQLEDQILTVTAPFWRTDIERREDVVEEVGRLNGYEKLSLDLPKRDLRPAKKDELLDLKSKLRFSLSQSGANEVLTYSFVHGNLLDKVGQDRALALQLNNALSPDLQYYRLNLMPSLLDKVHLNLKAGHSQFALFEIGKSHILNDIEPNEPGLPREVNTLSLVFAQAQKSHGAPFFEAKAFFLKLLQDFEVDQPKLQLLSGSEIEPNSWVSQLVAPYQPTRSAIWRASNGSIGGVIGEFREAVKRDLKLPDFCAGFEFDPLVLLEAAKRKDYRPLSRYPKVDQDICLKIPLEISYQQLLESVEQAVDQLKPEHTRTKILPLDIYVRDDDSSHQQITFRLEIASYDRTMTDAEVNQLLDKIAEVAKNQFGAERL